MVLRAGGQDYKLRDIGNLRLGGCGWAGAVFNIMYRVVHRHILYALVVCILPWFLMLRHRIRKNKTT